MCAGVRVACVYVCRCACGVCVWGRGWVWRECVGAGVRVACGCVWGGAGGVCLWVGVGGGGWGVGGGGLRLVDP